MSRTKGSGPDRTHLLNAWLQRALNAHAYSYGEPIADASSRQYLRIKTALTTYVVMDAPDQAQSLENFIRIANELRQIAIDVPVVHAVERNHGFVLLSDLGERSYFDVLNAGNADSLYRAALDNLIRIQTTAPVTGLPNYDSDLLQREMNMFIDWFLNRHLGIELNSTEQRLFDEAFRFLIDTALAQPRCFVHRDYHSRNLMLSSTASPGVLDFQDAVYGPSSYDVVSLLRDVYTVWSPEKVRAWARHYYRLAVQHGVLKDIADEQFLRWFDLMGAQRHLKIPGIFSRLYYRDGKPGYLKDIPKALRYLAAVTAQYPELAQFHSVLEGMQLELRTERCTHEALR